MPYRSRQEIEAENLVLLGKLEALRDELDDFLGDEEEADVEAEDYDPEDEDDEPTDEEEAD